MSMKLDSQTLQFVMALQKALCDVLIGIDRSSARIDLARHVAEDAARIIRQHGQVPAEVPHDE